MANESALRQRIGQLLRENGFFVQAIESSTNPGMPDMYVRKRAACWIEFKLVKQMPKRSTTPVFASMNHPLSNEQINWIDQELCHGGQAYILVGYEREYFLVPGAYAYSFNMLTESRLRMYSIQKKDIPLALERTNATQLF